MQNPQNLPKKEDLSKLKDLLKPLINVIETHISATHDMYLNHTVSKGAFTQALNRYALFHSILNFDENKEIILKDPQKNNKLSPIQRLLFCLSPCTINMVEGLEDIATQDVKKAKEAYSRLLDFFRENGFDVNDMLPTI